jgi:hypothetical protein
MLVPAASPQRQPEKPPAHPPRVYTLEATGLIIIAVLVLILTVIRYWRHIPWGAR